MKKIVVVNTKKQAKEKNAYWGDYPTMNYLTGRPLKRNLDHYYDSWEQYIETLEKNNIEY